MSSDLSSVEKIQCGSAWVGSLFPLMRRHAFDLELMPSVCIDGVRYDEDDPIEPGVDYEPGVSWTPKQTFQASRESVVILAEDLSRVLNPSPTPIHISDQQDDKPLLTKERNSLLAIIGLLADQSGLDRRATSKTAQIIESAASLNGIKLSRRTIEEHLKKVSQAIDHLSR